jgi:hypothetical protein
MLENRSLHVSHAGVLFLPICPMLEERLRSVPLSPRIIDDDQVWVQVPHLSGSSFTPLKFGIGCLKLA